jgi:DNA-3-methyladenine glycosylase
MDKDFLEQDTVQAAEKLIGCHLIRETPHGTIRVQITETEAYKGSDDPASHAYRGVTPRNQLMFSDVGRLYVYFIYGMHYCMNIIAHRPGEVGAVLLRAGKPLEGIELIRGNRLGAIDRNLMNGPGKLAQALNVDLSLNGYDLLQHTDRKLYLEMNLSDKTIEKTARIGISKGTEALWRFVQIE